MVLRRPRAVASINLAQVKGTALSQAQPEPRPPLLRRPVFWLAVGAAVLLVAVAVFAGMTIGASSGGAGAAASDRPTPSAPATDASAAPSTEPPAGTAPPSGDPGAAVIPASCADAYTRDWGAELGGLALNPAWTEVPGNGPLWGSNDNGAITVLEATSRLRCAWVSSGGGGDVGIITNLASLTAEQEASMAAYLAGAGQTCYAELDGTRCVVEWNSDAGDSGESHFLRDGIWSATRWSNVAAEGYTHDIVAAIFG